MFRPMHDVQATWPGCMQTTQMRLQYIQKYQTRQSTLRNIKELYQRRELKAPRQVIEENYSTTVTPCENLPGKSFLEYGSDCEPDLLVDPMREMVRQCSAARPRVLHQVAAIRRLPSLPRSKDPRAAMWNITQSDDSNHSTQVQVRPQCSTKESYCGISNNSNQNLDVVYLSTEMKHPTPFMLYHLSRILKRAKSLHAVHLYGTISCFYQKRQVGT